jgi:hypothetical protein
MGVVPSIEQVRAGQLPHFGQSIEAAHAMRGLVAPDGPIVAGIWYGSTVYGQATLLSDLDVRLFYQPNREQDAIDQYQSCLSDLQAAGNNTPVEAHLSDTVIRRFLPGDLQYTEHLLRTIRDKPEWALGQPEQYLPTQAVTPEAILTDAFGFIESKWQKFAKVEAYDQVDYKVMQRALELPTAIGRKVFSVLRLTDGTDFDTVDKRSMRQKAVQYLEGAVMAGVSGAIPTLRAHSLLLAAERECANSIESIVYDQGSPDCYEAWLRYRYPVVVRQARVYASGWRRILDSIVDDVLH